MHSAVSSVVSTIIFATVFMTMTGCSSVPPRSEYALARAALQASQATEAQRFSPDLYLKAESLFKKGQRAFDSEEYTEAKKLFDQSRLFAEKAEDQSRIKKIKADSAP